MKKKASGRGSASRQEKPTSAASGRRDQLVETAARLFYRSGFRATGIDTVLAESGVAKMTLYKHFKTKDDLIVATLKRLGETWTEWFGRTVEGLGRTPRERLLAVFDALDRWFRGEGTGEAGFCGCPFINVTGEYGDPGHLVHAVAAEQKRRVLSYVMGLAREAGAKDPQALGRQLCLLAEGAIVRAHVAGDRQSAKHARQAAEVLVASAGLS